MSLTTAVLETRFAEQFKEFIKGESDPILRQLREEAFVTFTYLGFPTSKNEDWKYTDVRRIANTPWTVFPSAILPDKDLTPNLDGLKAFNSGRNGFTALNT